MLINIPNIDPKSPAYAKIKADVMKALGLEKEWENIKWPLPNLSEVDEKTFWSHAMMWSFAADVYGGHIMADGEWNNCRVYWVNHSHLIDGGFVVLYQHEWRKEKTRYFKWTTCNHKFLGKTVGRCLTRYTCENCGKSYEIDSSD